MKKVGKHHHRRGSVQAWLVNIEMEFTNDDGSTTWWPGTIMKYKSTSDIYEVYFPDDCTTVEFSSFDEDCRIISK